MSMGTKFEGVDVLDFLGQVVELHTQHYKEDFDMDKELIQNLARNMQPEKCNLLWMSLLFERAGGVFTG